MRVTEILDAFLPESGDIAARRIKNLYALSLISGITARAGDKALHTLGEFSFRVPQNTNLKLVSRLRYGSRQERFERLAVNLITQPVE
jgi:hypothetical protein